MSGSLALEQVVVRRRFRASKERVFRAWTEPEQLMAWWNPMGVTAQEMSVDLRPGGCYRFHVHNPEGTSLVVEGSFLEVDPGNRLMYTWKWKGSSEPETCVTVEFLGDDTETEVVLTHERFVSEETRMHHTKGWGACFDSLTEYL